MPRIPPATNIPHRFAPGNNANPRGARAHNPVKKEFKRLTEQQLREVMELILDTHPDKLEELKTHMHTTTLKAWIAQAALKGLESGDMGPLLAILDRVLGRIKERVEISTVKDMSDEELTAKAIELEQKLKSLEPV